VLLAGLVDRERLAALHRSCSLVEARRLLCGAFWTDVRAKACGAFLLRNTCYPETPLALITPPAAK
jgi:hypothetical protein